MQGTHDLKRLSSVIKSQRVQSTNLTTRRSGSLTFGAGGQVFDVVTEDDVAKGQRELASEIDPQINELIARAEAGIERVKAREQLARSKVALLSLHIVD